MSIDLRAAEGGRRAPAPLAALSVELEDCDAVALSDDSTLRDHRRVRQQAVELLVADPGAADLGRLLALLGGVEEARRAEDRAVVRLDQVVALEPGQLAQLRDEGVVD